MGTKFSVTAVSGYNSSPPADDGTVSASNQVTWASQKTKLTDPIKTAYDANMTALATALNQSAVSLTTNTNLDASYHNKTAEIASTATSGITISLGDAATMAAGYIVTITNQSAFAQTIGRVTGGDTINGTASNATIYSKETLTFIVNASVNGYDLIGGYHSLEGTYTSTLTGGTTTPTVVTRYVRRGGFVTLTYAASLSVTSNATTKTYTGMPSSLWPSTVVQCPYPAIDNGGAQTAGVLNVGTNGVVTFFPTYAAGNWTSSGSTTIGQFSIQYVI